VISFLRPMIDNDSFKDRIKTIRILDLNWLCLVCLLGIAPAKHVSFWYYTFEDLSLSALSLLVVVLFLHSSTPNHALSFASSPDCFYENQDVERVRRFSTVSFANS